MATIWKRFIRKIGGTLFPADAYLKEVSGVIHVGANTGQERDLYERFHLNVLWIEPIPSVFEQLRVNLVGFPKQRAYQRLLTDRDDQEYVLHVASNEGASSSILPLAKHRAMWPEIYYTGEVKLKSATLDSFVAKEALDLTKLQALVLDTQGSELMILKGAPIALPQFRFVKIEVPDFESYEGCCLSREVTHSMANHGFRERRRDAFESIPGVGTYFDVLYKRVGDGR